MIKFIVLSAVVHHIFAFGKVVGYMGRVMRKVLHCRCSTACSSEYLLPLIKPFVGHAVARRLAALDECVGERIAAYVPIFYCQQVHTYKIAAPSAGLVQCAVEHGGAVCLILDVSLYLLALGKHMCNTEIVLEETFIYILQCGAGVALQKACNRLPNLLLITLCAGEYKQQQCYVEYFV